jgi:hypothetical protein
MSAARGNRERPRLQPNVGRSCEPDRDCGVVARGFAVRRRPRSADRSMDACAKPRQLCRRGVADDFHEGYTHTIHRLRPCLLTFGPASWRLRRTMRSGDGAPRTRSPAIGPGAEADRADRACRGRPLPACRAHAPAVSASPRRMELAYDPSIPGRALRPRVRSAPPPQAATAPACSGPCPKRPARTGRAAARRSP